MCRFFHGLSTSALKILTGQPEAWLCAPSTQQEETKRMTQKLIAALDKLGLASADLADLLDEELMNREMATLKAAGAPPADVIEAAQAAWDAAKANSWMARVFPATIDMSQDEDPAPQLEISGSEHILICFAFQVRVPIDIKERIHEDGAAWITCVKPEHCLMVVKKRNLPLRFTGSSREESIHAMADMLKFNLLVAGSGTSDTLYWRWVNGSFRSSLQAW